MKIVSGFWRRIGIFSAGHPDLLHQSTPLPADICHFAARIGGLRYLSVVPLPAVYYRRISSSRGPRTVAKRTNHMKTRRGWSRIALCPLAASLLLTACQQEPKAEAPEVRPVRTMTVEKGEIGEGVSLTGRIQAENEAALAFRISGRMNERPVGVGDRVVPGEVLAKLRSARRAERTAFCSSQTGCGAGKGEGGPQ